MDVTRFQHRDSVTIRRSPDDLYALVCTMESIGDLSPVATGVSWDEPDRAGQEGAWFTGHNAIGELTWETRCKVVVADPGREFAFVNHGFDGEVPLVRWGFVFEPADDATLVTETWEVLSAYPDFVRKDRPDASDDEVAERLDGMGALARDGIRDTLAALKQVAER